MTKALIVAPSWIGDTIMAQPLFVRLHARHPDLQLDALAPSWVAPVLQRMDEIREVTPMKQLDIGQRDRTDPSYAVLKG